MISSSECGATLSERRPRPSSSASSSEPVCCHSAVVARTNAALSDNETHPLLIVAAFSLDLLCIHPFADGNGRTGLVVGCYLARHGLASGKDALEQIRRLRSADPLLAGRKSPETMTEEKFVLRWRTGR